MRPHRDPTAAGPPAGTDRWLSAAHARRWPLLAAAILVVAILLLGPDAHVSWQPAGTIPAEYSCPPGMTPAPRQVTVGPRTMSIVECRGERPDSTLQPTVATVVRASRYVPEEHRLALYLAGPKWRLFDLDFSSGIFAGFATEDVYEPD